MSLALALTAALWTASADDVVREVDAAMAADEDAGAAQRAEALAALAGSVAAAEAAAFQAILAEAWLEAGDPAKAEAAAAAALAAPAQRERAGLALIAAWQQRVRAAAEPAQAPALDLARYGDLGPLVAARALCAEAAWQIDRGMHAPPPGAAPAAVDADGKALLDRIDRALALLDGKPPETRVPVYSLRLLAMERLRRPAAEVQAWLQSRSADPAAAQLAELALTGGQRLVGAAAPRLRAPRLDGQAAAFDQAATAGKPLLIVFVATWSPASDAVMAATPAAAARIGGAAVAVSLDNRDTRDRVPGWVARLAPGVPVIGDGIGWDSELDDIWQVDRIPSAILVDADGKIRAVDLAEGPPEQLADRAAAALGGAPAPGPGPAAPAPAPAADVVP